MKRRVDIRFLGLVAVAVMLSAMAAFYLVGDGRHESAQAKSSAAWTEIAWPFARDQFPPGKAFECGSAGCESGLRITFRAKIGFCNCATGVSDDEELERIGDVDLIGPSFQPRGPGREILVGHMKGRSRPYLVEGPDAAKTPVISVAFNDHCDVIVATATGAGSERDDADVTEFLNSDAQLRWAERALGL